MLWNGITIQNNIRILIYFKMPFILLLCWFGARITGNKALSDSEIVTIYKSLLSLLINKIILAEKSINFFEKKKNHTDHKLLNVVYVYPQLDVKKINIDLNWLNVPRIYAPDYRCIMY